MPASLDLTDENDQNFRASRRACLGMACERRDQVEPSCMPADAAQAESSTAVEVDRELNVFAFVSC
jgi:hypothetical protein